MTARPWDFLNPNTEYVSEEERNTRFEICKACPHFIKFSAQCRKCGCFMAGKTKMAKAKCPVGNW